MIDDPAYRVRIAARIDDPVIAHYWQATVPALSPQTFSDVARPISNKLRAVLSDPAARHIIGQPTTSFDMRRLMDEGHVLIANLATRRLGDGIAHLIGAILTTVLTSTAFTRDPATAPRPFYFYADEFQSFANGAFGQILSQSRKFGLALTLSHQYLAQVPEDLRAAVLGNAATTISFRVGAEDAPLLARHLALDEIYAEAEHKGHHQLTNLANFQAFVRTLEDNQPVTYALSPYPAPQATAPRAARVIANSRARFGRPLDKVEAQIEHFYRHR